MSDKKNIIEDVGKGVRINNEWSGNKDLKEDNLDNWSKKDAQQWMAENDFSIKNYKKTLRWHVFEINSPEEHDNFMIDKSPFGFDYQEGVQLIKSMINDDKNNKENIQIIKFYRGGE